MVRYLTKSKFKSGLECVTKLYYTGKKKEYADQKIDDKFLQALAEGGHQTGALALFEFCDNPIADDIIVKHAVGKVIDIYEVKAKSWNSDVEDELSFISYLDKKNESINSKWAPYLYDIAFQKYVVTKAFPDYTVNSHLSTNNK